VAALSATIPTNTGTITAGAAVAATDTIAQSVMGSRGAYLRINNGNASSDVITISDSGLTPAGNALATGTISDTITTGQAQIYYIRNEQVNSSTGLVTITHSVQTTVTYELWPVGI